MSQTVILQLPDEAAYRYRRGATAARKPLEAFLLERLTEAVPPAADPPMSPLDDELRRMEELGDEALWEIARAALPPAQQRRYDRLLGKNAASSLTAGERATLWALGEEARRLTLMKAHARLILKWRGHMQPPPDEPSVVE
jgi:hypothetical protein